MVVIEGNIWIGYQDLLDLSEGDIKEVINKGLYRNRHKKLGSWLNQKIAGLVHIRYDSIPATTIKKYNLPALHQVSRTMLSRLVEPDRHAYLYYESNPITRSKKHEYTLIASWLITITSLSRRQCRSLGFATLDALYQCALEQMASQCDPELWNTTSLQWFKRTKLPPFKRLTKTDKESILKDLRRAAFNSLVTGKIGNDNSKKLSKSQKALLVQIYSQPNKPTIEQTYQMYMMRATEQVAIYEQTEGAHGWPEKSLVSISAVRHYLTRPRVQQMVFEHRHGFQQYRDKYEIVTKRKRPEIANGLWVIDGSPVHRYYVHQGKSYARLNAFVILDAHSWCVLGFYISETEDTAAVLGGLRAACELSGKRPYQILYDHSSAIKSYEAQAAIRAISVYSTPAGVGNARTKVIEPFFKQFNSQVLKFRTGYTASPVGANTLDGKPNREALSKDAKIFPSTKVAIQELHEDFSIWNNRPMKDGKTPLEKYQESIQASASRQLPFMREHLVEAFYTMPGERKVRNIIEEGTTRKALEFVPRTYNYTNKGITYSVGGIQYQCLVANAQFNAQHIGKQFSIKYDPQNPQEVFLYQGMEPVLFQDQLCKAEPVDQFSMALMDRRDGEAAHLSSHLQEKKKQRSLVLARYSEAVETTRLEDTYTPAITANAFDKAVLNAAKSQQLEQLIQGEDYRLENPSTNEKPKKISRWL